MVITFDAVDIAVGVLVDVDVDGGVGVSVHDARYRTTMDRKKQYATSRH